MWKSPWILWGAVLGFAFGGFADGILLHQILQWHHLLSLVPGLTDVRTQVLWDGYFHALMYLTAAVGLAGLWRAHRGALEVSRRRLVGALLLGFGLWHVVDGVLSHWLLGIHRIKLDSQVPLIWDLTWFFGFGVVPLVVGVLMVRGGARGRPRPAARLSLLALTAAAVGAGAWALRPPSDQPFTTIVFGADLRPAQVVAALASLDARLVWADAAMGVVVAEVAPERRWDFYAEGALLVSGSGVPAGCFAWSRAR